MASYWPWASKRTCAVGKLKAASVAPARLSEVPKLTRPLIRKVCGGPANSTRTGWPTSKWYLRAVPTSITRS